jgi:transposase
MSRRARRAFTAEQKEEAVRLVQTSGRSVYQVAHDLDLTETALRRWVQQAEIDARRGPEGALSTEQLVELRDLRRENKRLRMERDFLKKAAAFFAKESSSITS